MTIGRKQCHECDHRAADGWHISKKGLCRWCAVRRAADIAGACFPPDPPAAAPAARAAVEQWMADVEAFDARFPLVQT